MRMIGKSVEEEEADRKGRERYISQRGREKRERVKEREIDSRREIYRNRKRRERLQG